MVMRARALAPPRRLGVVAYASDEALVEGLRARHPAALSAFHERFSGHVLRVLGRLLGSGHDLSDAHHDAFVRALSSLDTLRDPAALKAWMTSVAVFTARTCIQRRARRRWLLFFAPEELPPLVARPHEGEAHEALRATYRALDRLPADERIAFALRRIDGMELQEVADACGVSLATIKRRLARAEANFLEAARDQPALEEWLK
ncbi:RNA polymerase subunit sigma [Sorangium cellulosum]|uniref:RNA polymerase subunit sigma n=1 Tax=Sorangium cellulosum TaxID=56 RepID=A0A150U1B2_SORCE|nr:RNA polymerase subunit sigma [Sorangium cellulosum]